MAVHPDRIKSETSINVSCDQVRKYQHADDTNFVQAINISTVSLGGRAPVKASDQSASRNVKAQSCISQTTVWHQCTRWSKASSGQLFIGFESAVAVEVNPTLQKGIARCRLAS